VVKIQLLIFVMCFKKHIKTYHSRPYQRSYLTN